MRFVISERLNWAVLVVCFVVALLAVFVGCEALPAPDSQSVEQFKQGAEAVGDAADPITGGVSGLVTLIVTNLATAGLAINRGIVAHQRKNTKKDS